MASHNNNHGYLTPSSSSKQPNTTPIITTPPPNTPPSPQYPTPPQSTSSKEEIKQPKPTPSPLTQLTTLLHPSPESHQRIQDWESYIRLLNTTTSDLHPPDRPYNPMAYTNWLADFYWQAYVLGTGQFAFILDYPHKARIIDRILLAPGGGDPLIKAWHECRIHLRNKEGYLARGVSEAAWERRFELLKEGLQVEIALFGLGCSPGHPSWAYLSEVAVPPVRDFEGRVFCRL